MFSAIQKTIRIGGTPIIFGLGALLLSNSPVLAQTAGENAFAEDGGWLETWLDGFSVHGQLQFLPTYEGNFDFRKSTDDNSDRIGQKSQIGFQKEFNARYTARVTLQDSRVWGGTPGSDSGLNTANALTEEAIDLREGWLQANQLLGPIDIRLGRQIIALGDHRLVGRNDWGNVGRSFDALKFRLKNSWYEGNLWGSVLAEEDNDRTNNRTAVGSNRASNFSITCDDTGSNCTLTSGTPSELDDAYFTGFYNTFKFSEFAHLDAYYLGVHKKYINDSVAIVNFPGATVTTEDRSRQRDNLYTFGGRLTNHVKGRRKATIPFDYMIEYAYQTGRTGEEIDATWDLFQVSVPRLDPVSGTQLLDGAGNLLDDRIYKEKVRYDAYAYVVDAGFTLFDTVRIGGEYVVASGDPDRTDGTTGTFNTLFARGHALFGISDIQGWQNMIGRSGNLSFFFGKYGRLILGYWEVDKHRRQDGWYNGGGGLRANVTTESRANSRFGSTMNSDGTLSLGVGQLGKNLYREYDILYQVKYDDIFFELGYAHVYAGDAVRLNIDDLNNFTNRATPDFDPRADRIFMTVRYKF